MTCPWGWREKLASLWVCVGGRERPPSSVHPQVASLTTHLQTPGLVPSGPTHWKEIAPACGGPAQSPINIDLHLVQRDLTLRPFIFHGYDSAPPGPWTLENDGHTGQHPGLRTSQRQGQEPLALSGNSLTHTGIRTPPKEMRH